MILVAFPGFDFIKTVVSIIRSFTLLGEAPAVALFLSIGVCNETFVLFETLLVFVVAEVFGFWSRVNVKILSSSLRLISFLEGVLAPSFLASSIFVAFADLQQLT